MTDHIGDADKKEWIGENDNRGKICFIVSDMLDHPDSCGIYQTTKCFDQLERLLAEQRKRTIEEVEGMARKVTMRSAVKNNEYGDGIIDGWKLGINEFLSRLESMKKV